MKTDLVVGGYIFNNDKVLLVLHSKLKKWLPLGGHIDPNETFDQAMIREAKEESNLDIELLYEKNVGEEGNIVETLATPFYANVHNVGDHNHACVYYICRALNPDALNHNDNELLDIAWFSKEDLDSKRKDIPDDVYNQAQEAFRIYEEKYKEN